MPSYPRETLARKVTQESKAVQIAELEIAERQCHALSVISEAESLRARVLRAIRKAREAQEAAEVTRSKLQGAASDPPTALPS